MKNAIKYQNIWLMRTSQAYFLYELWQKSGKASDKKKELDDHMWRVDVTYKKLSGLK